MAQLPINTGPREADAYVQSIMDHDAEMAARQEQPPARQRSRLPMLLVLLPVALGLTAWNVSRVGDRPDPLSLETATALAQLHIHAAAQALERFRKSNGTYPESLQAVDAANPYLEYVSGNAAYTLTATVGPAVVSHRSKVKLAQFDSVYRYLRRAGRQ